MTNNTIFSSLILFNIRTIDLSIVSCKLEKGSSKISKDVLGFVTATKNCKSCLCPPESSLNLTESKSRIENCAASNND